jgi:hypothetical protein
VAAAPRAPVPSLPLQLGHSLSSSCDRTGARSIMQVRGSQRRDLCLGHRVLGLARARARVRAHERRPAPRSRRQGPVRSIVQALSAAIFS